MEDKRVKIFRETVYGHPLIAKAVEKFDFDFPDSRLHTFDAISAFVVVNLPNLKNASKVAAQATANIMFSEVYLTLEAENKVLKASLQQPSGKNKNNKRSGGKGEAKGDKSNNKGDKGNKRSKASNDQKKPLKYCHAHGSQNTHTSSKCKMMYADKARFSAAMRNAKTAENPLGGSTKVLDQSVQTTQ